MRKSKLLCLLVVFVLLLVFGCKNNPTGCKDNGEDGENSAPATPVITEGTSAIVDCGRLTFKATTTDPDNDKISYQFSWGDGDLSEWSNYIPSGDTITISHYHCYSNYGFVWIRVRAQDEKGNLSEWSEPHKVWNY
jgi:hypothetical protein